MDFDQGNEGVDVKEGSLNTVIENNKISMQRDENAGGKLSACRCPARRAMFVLCLVNSDTNRSVKIHNMIMSYVLVGFLSPPEAIIASLVVCFQTEIGLLVPVFAAFLAASQ